MTSSTTHRIAVVLAALVALAAFTGSALASTSKPSGMTKAEYRALVLRSEALNEKYRLGEWKNVPKGMTPPEYHALSGPQRGPEQALRPRQVEHGELQPRHHRCTNGFSVGSLRHRRGATARARPARWRPGRGRPAHPASPRASAPRSSSSRQPSPPVFLIWPGAMPCGCYPSARPQSRPFACASSRRAWIAESLQKEESRDSDQGSEAGDRRQARSRRRATPGRPKCRSRC